MKRASFYFVMLNSFSCAGLRLSIHPTPKAAVRDEKWILKQVQDDDDEDDGFVCNNPSVGKGDCELDGTSAWR